MKFTIPILILLFMAIIFGSGCSSKADHDDYVSPYAKYVNTTEYQQGYEKGLREYNDTQKRDECDGIIKHHSVNESDMAFAYGYYDGQERGAEQAQIRADQQAMANVRENSTE
jgi:hypothetical protein